MGLILYVDFIILPRIYRVYKKVADSVLDMLLQRSDYGSIKQKAFYEISP